MSDGDPLPLDCVYTFDTEAECTAFMRGVEQANGRRVVSIDGENVSLLFGA